MRILPDRTRNASREFNRGISFLRRAFERGVNLVDTADIYGDGQNELLVGAAIRPMSAHISICTKVGLRRTASGSVSLDLSAEYIQDACEKSRRRLGRSTIDLLLLHQPPKPKMLPKVIECLEALRLKEHVRYIGLCNVTPTTVRSSLQFGRVDVVQNELNVTRPESLSLLPLCLSERMLFMASAPLGGSWELRGGPLAAADGIMAGVAHEHSVTPAQASLAWLLDQSPCILAIPGTYSRQHLDENLATLDLAGLPRYFHFS